MEEEKRWSQTSFGLTAGQGSAEEQDGRGLEEVLHEAPDSAEDMLGDGGPELEDRQTAAGGRGRALPGIPESEVEDVGGRS
jgi:hypothetical protein